MCERYPQSLLLLLLMLVNVFYDVCCRHLHVVLWRLMSKYDIMYGGGRNIICNVTLSYSNYKTNHLPISEGDFSLRSLKL
jgi:hypothetical protein